MKIPMKKTMVFFAVGVAALPVIAMAFLIFAMNFDIREIVRSEFDKIGVKSTRQIVEDTAKICRIIRRTQADEDEKARISLRARLSELGAARLAAETFEVSTAPQNKPNEVSQVKIRKLAFGGSLIEPKFLSNGSFDGASGRVVNILESLKTDTGLDFSVFVRMNENGDMFRLASTADAESDAPLSGLYLPASGGSDEGLIVRTLLARKTYSGVARTGRNDFLANYEPILDAYGDVVGALSYGRSTASIDFLTKYFEGIRIGSSGYVWAVELIGRGESVIRASRDGKRDGVLIEDDAIAERRTTMMEMLSAAVAQGDGKVSLREIKTESSEDGSDILAAYTYFKPWNMVIGATVYRGDLTSGVDTVKASTRRFIFMLMPLGLGMLGFAGIAAWLAAARGVQMTGGIVSAADKIKRGDIAAAQRELSELTDPRKWSNSEIFGLALALKTMSSNLSSLVSKVQTSGVSVADSAAKISVGANEINSIAAARTATIAEVSETLGTISKSVMLLGSDSREAAKEADASMSAAGGGGELLARLDDNAASLLGAADSVSARLAVIRDKTERMLAAVSTINAVSERTNMLSLNASIEAERVADASGTGFDAVASEISKLSDRTAVSTMHISKIVRAMNDSVETGVSETENFSARMKSNGGAMSSMRGNIETVAAGVGELGPKFESLAHSIDAQKGDAVEIGRLMGSIEDCESRTRDCVKTLNEINGEIGRMSKSLVEKVSQFKLPPCGGEGSDA